MYIVIEGQDATGKSTQVELLADYYRSQGKEVITMHEPDGELASTHELRRLIKDKDFNLEPMSHVLLFSAARQELWRKLAEPVLKRNGFVISARNWWSTLAYQGYGQGISRTKIVRITKDTLPDKYVKPDRAIILVLPESVRQERQGQRSYDSNKDTFESKPEEFQHRVDNAYLKIAKEYNIPLLDTSGNIDETQQQIRKILGI